MTTRLAADLKAVWLVIILFPGFNPGRNIRRRQSIAFVRFVNPKSPRFHEFRALFFG